MEHIRLDSKESNLELVELTINDLIDQVNYLLKRTSLNAGAINHTCHGNHFACNNANTPHDCSMHHKHTIIPVLYVFRVSFTDANLTERDQSLYIRDLSKLVKSIDFIKSYMILDKSDSKILVDGIKTKVFNLESSTHEVNVDAIERMLLEDYYNDGNITDIPSVPPVKDPDKPSIEDPVPDDPNKDPVDPPKDPVSPDDKKDPVNPDDSDTKEPENPDDTPKDPDVENPPENTDNKDPENPPVNPDTPTTGDNTGDITNPDDKKDPVDPTIPPTVENPDDSNKDNNPSVINPENPDNKDPEIPSTNPDDTNKDNTDITDKDPVNSDDTGTTNPENREDITTPPDTTVPDTNLENKEDTTPDTPPVDNTTQEDLNKV